VAVVSDLLAIARRSGGAPAAWPGTSAPAAVGPLTVAPYYLRLVVRDQPGIIASLASIFSAHGINIDAVLQEPGNTKERLPFVITLEACPTSAMAQAVAQIATLPFHVTPPLCLPVLA
jgi:homoserine dehydrogenase